MSVFRDLSRYFLISSFYPSLLLDIIFLFFFWLLFGMLFAKCLILKFLLIFFFNFLIFLLCIGGRWAAIIRLYRNVFFIPVQVELEFFRRFWMTVDGFTIIAYAYIFVKILYLTELLTFWGKMDIVHKMPLPNLISKVWAQKRRVFRHWRIYIR